MSSIINRYISVALIVPSLLLSDSDCVTPSYECAFNQVKNEDFTSAALTLEKLVSTTAEPRILNLLGIALTGMDQLETANEQFRAALSINASFYPALKNLAVNEFNAGQHGLAASHFRQVLEWQPSDEVSHLHLGEIAVASSDWEVAVTHYQKSMSQALANPQILLRYASSLLQVGEFEKAATVLHRLEPDQSESHFQAGTLLGNAGRHSDAANHFGLAAHGYSDPYSASYNQVLMFVRASMFSQAIAVADRMFEEGFKRAELYNLLSEAYLGNHQLQQAYDALRTATQVDPGHEKSYGDLISLCMSFSNFQLGLDIAKVGIHHLPRSYRLHVQRGVMQAKLGRLTEAQSDFEYAAHLSPQEPLPYATLAIALMQQGALEDAILSLRRQIQTNPDYFLSQYLLGEALVRSGVGASGAASDQALAAFETAVRLHPDFGPARVSLGKLLLNRDEIDAAIQHLEAAMTLDPDESAPIYQLARAYQRQGNRDRARDLMASVRELAEKRRNETMDSVLRDVVRESRSQ